eukprot:6174767-Pleurochrysis_carterae.AAC.1
MLLKYLRNLASHTALAANLFARRERACRVLADEALVHWARGQPRSCFAKCDDLDQRIVPKDGRNGGLRLYRTRHRCTAWG